MLFSDDVNKCRSAPLCPAARRMAKIAWKMLTEHRDYSKVPIVAKPLSPAALVTD